MQSTYIMNYYVWTPLHTHPHPNPPPLFFLTVPWSCRTMIKYHINKSFNPFSNRPWFLRVCSTSLENTVGKGEIALNEQFLLFPQCFLSVWRTFFHFHQIWNCRLQMLSVWKGLKFVVWERVNTRSVNDF